MEYSIDESALIADLIGFVKDFEDTPKRDTRRREALSKLIIAYSNILFAPHTPKENLQLLDDMKKLKEIL